MRQIIKLAIYSILTVSIFIPNTYSSEKNVETHALAMHGEPKFKSDFKHFDHVNPYAPKGGIKITSAMGTYDSLNPFILQGNPASTGIIYDSLMVQSVDEAFSLYCLLCKTVKTPSDRSWVEFTLRNDAYWHDGKPITVEDVIFSFNILRSKGRPFYRFYYGNVSRVEKTGTNKVKFTFSGTGATAFS